MLKLQSIIYIILQVFMCPDGLLPSGVPQAQCYSDRNQTPSPADFTCKSASEPESGMK